MKLNAILEQVKRDFKAVPQDILIPHIEKIWESKEFHDFETRIAWDLLRATNGANICQWYKEYNCNDTHLTTLAKNALSQVFNVRGFINSKQVTE